MLISTFFCFLWQTELDWRNNWCVKFIQIFFLDYKNIFRAVKNIYKLMWLISAGIMYCTTLLCKFFAIIFPSQVKCQSWEAESWSWHLRSCLRCSAAAQLRWSDGDQPGTSLCFPPPTEYWQHNTWTHSPQLRGHQSLIIKAARGYVGPAKI